MRNWGCFEHLCTPVPFSLASQSSTAWLEEKSRCLKIEGEFCWLSQDWRGKLGKCLSFTEGIFTAVSELKGIQFPLEQLCQCRAEPRRISHSTGYQANKMNWERSSRSRHFKALRVSGFHCIERICQVLELQAQVIKQRNVVFTFIYQACNWLWYHWVLWRTPLESKDSWP